MKGKMLAIIACVAIVSCTKPYKEPLFGGMKGQVREVKTWYMMPEMWHADQSVSDIYYITSATYDYQGREINSTVMDSQERVQRKAGNYFKGDICIQSDVESDNRLISRIKFLSKKGCRTEYEKTDANGVTNMTLRESSFLRRHKSIISENGVEKQKSVTVTDRNGLPVKIVTVNKQTGDKTVEKNWFDEYGNVIEKLLINNGEPDDTVSYEYFAFDEQGNWTEARTYNFKVLPVEVIIREIKYW